MDVRRAPRLILVVILSLILSGCSFWPNSPNPRETVPHDAASGGQTSEEMRTTLENIPGIELETLNGGGEPNIKGYTGYSFVFSIDPGYQIVDGTKFVNFLTESAWSVRNGYMPNGLISIAVKSRPPASFDVSAAAAEAGWVPPSEPVAGSQGYSIADIIVYDDSPARRRLGAWPGPTPTIPTDITAPIPEGESTPDD